MAIHQNWYSVFGGFSQIFKTRFLAQTLVSQRNINLTERFMDQNLSSLGTENALKINDLVFMLCSVE